MESPDEYRRLAIECLRLASNASDETSRTMFVHMAKAWASLADWWATWNESGKHPSAIADEPRSTKNEIEPGC